MLFNSIEFLVFFPLVISAYFLLPHKYRWLFLLVASYYFYMCWKVEYVLLIFLSTIVDYFAGIKMASLPDKRSRKPYLILSLVVNLGLLFVFKYFNFFNYNLTELFKTVNIFYEAAILDFLLPVGISFYTFQTLSYTIDVYKGKIKAERHFGIFALFVSYFPQLVAGPIERASRLIPQLHQKFEYNYERVRDGLLLIIWGLFKKLVIADRLAEYVNLVYNNQTEFGGLQLIIASFFFTFQLYCDFSGYSDIAIGTARVMGVKLMLNFKRPFLAQSMQEAFNRWHISLFHWFRDYIYIPLGLKHREKWQRYGLTMLVFFLAGLWHGAAWNFIWWGLFSGSVIVMAGITFKMREKLNRAVGLDKTPKVDAVINILFTYFWSTWSFVIFRFNSMEEGLMICKKMFAAVFMLDVSGVINLFRIPSDFYIAFAAIAFLMIIECFQEKFGSKKFFYEMLNRTHRYALAIILILAIMFTGKFEEIDFLYFQF